jgi:hypothetical protein
MDLCAGVHCDGVSGVFSFESDFISLKLSTISMHKNHKGKQRVRDKLDPADTHSDCAGEQGQQQHHCDE